MGIYSCHSPGLSGANSTPTVALIQSSRNSSQDERIHYTPSTTMGSPASTPSACTQFQTTYSMNTSNTDSIQPTEAAVVPIQPDYTSSIAAPLTAQAVFPDPLSGAEVKKLHLHLKHASVTQMRDYLKAGDLWSRTLQTTLVDTVQSSRCHIATPPTPHPLSSTSPPSPNAHEHLAIDVIDLEGTRFFHCVDRCTGWAELRALRSRHLAEQARVFKVIQLWRHGIRRSILCDNEFSKGEFLALCSSLDIELKPVPSHAHEANCAA